ncbi:MAG TPA: PDZ domain-containing protein [Thermoanaerobaculia bacterium]|nr:PDZ domain-containing protein [Thermoanaerobaculia bacterium]
MNGWKTNTLLGLATGLLLLPPGTGAARAEADKPGAPRVEKVVRERVVLVDDQGKSTTLDTVKRLPGGYLGVGLLDLTPELRTHFGVPEDAGVLVSKVEPGSPAEKAGIKVGDILTGIDGKPAGSSFDVRHRIRSAEEGAQPTLEIWRNGKVQTLTATLEKRSRPEFDLTPLIFKKNGDQLFLARNGEDPLPLKMEPGHLLKLQRLQGRDADVEKRMKELEKRIKDLERQLEKQQH